MNLQHQAKLGGARGKDLNNCKRLFVKILYEILNMRYFVDEKLCLQIDHAKQLVCTMSLLYLKMRIPIYVVRAHGISEKKNRSVFCSNFCLFRRKNNRIARSMYDPQVGTNMSREVLYKDWNTISGGTHPLHLL